MSGDKFNSRHAPLKILIAPLDWGLGHATRCIPIINHLISQHVEVLIAASDNSFFLLKKEFPELNIFSIKGYKIRYSRKKGNMPITLLIQFPKLFLAVLIEHFWLKKIIKKHQLDGHPFDAVISDNRLGMYNRNVISIYLTHQLLIKTGNRIPEGFFQKLHHFFIKRFDSCWVPDYQKNDLAGELSHPVLIPGNVKYIGPLSRFEAAYPVKKIYDACVILSGPEPQRTIFEWIVLSQVKGINRKIILIRGLPGEKEILQNDNTNLEIVNHPGTKEMRAIIQQSKIVIGRSGYSTIMDLIKLGSNAVLVPTPGQTEQEYLTRYLMQKRYFYGVDQSDFKLDEVLNTAETFPFVKPKIEQDLYKNVLDEFVQSCKSGNFALQ